MSQKGSALKISGTEFTANSTELSLLCKILIFNMNLKYRDQINTLKKNNSTLFAENSQLKILNQKLVNRVERMDTELDIIGGLNPFKEPVSKLLFTGISNKY